MKEYLKTKDDVLAEVKSGQIGLSSAEASTRLEQNGKNKLAEGKKDSLITLFVTACRPYDYHFDCCCRYQCSYRNGRR